MNDIKEKKFLIKIRKQVIFAEKWDSLNFYRKIEVTTLVDHLKLCDTTLINVKDLNVQAEICFIYHKLSHIFKECSDWLFKVNALNDENEFNHLNFDSDLNSKN